jgi:hypothetical protein
MRQVEWLADRLLGLFVPRVTAAAASTQALCGACMKGVSCTQLEFQTCQVIGGGTGLRSRTRTCTWDFDCTKVCGAWGPWGLCSVG